MHDIIAVNLRHIGDTETHTTSARDLHAFLEVGKVFGAWIQERIEQYEFEQGKDYEVFSESGNNPAGFAEAIPFENNGHAGYQILWNPKVADQLKAAA